MAADRISLAKILIESGGITEFKDVVAVVPKTVLAQTIGTGNERITNLVDNPERFTLEELYQVSEFFQTDHQHLIRISCNQFYKKLADPDKGN